MKLTNKEVEDIRRLLNRTESEMMDLEGYTSKAQDQIILGAWMSFAEGIKPYIGKPMIESILQCVREVLPLDNKIKSRTGWMINYLANRADALSPKHLEWVASFESQFKKNGGYLSKAQRDTLEDIYRKY